MEKNLLLNLDKLVWVRLKKEEESSKYVYEEGKPKKKFLGIIVRRERLPRFVNLHDWRNDNEVSKEEILAEGYIVTEDNKVMIKPRLKLLLQGVDSASEIFYDTFEEAESEFSRIKFLLHPNVLQCN